MSKGQQWSRWQLSKALILLVLCVFLLSGFAVSCRAASESDAQSAVDRASKRIITCYGAVASSAKAGANVSSLLVVLNDAGGLRDRAEVALASGDFDSAVTLAGQSVQLLIGLDGEAVTMQNSAKRAGFDSFLVSEVGSFVGAVAVLAGSFGVWSWLKSRQKKSGKVVS